MTTLGDPGVGELLEQPNYAVVSTHNRDSSIHSTVIWIALENGEAVSIKRAGEQRIKFVVKAQRVRLYKT